MTTTHARTSVPVQGTPAAGGPAPAPPPGDGPVLAALHGLAELPDWLAAGVDGDRVASALAAAAPDLVPLTVQPQRLRAKGGRWLARYLVRSGADGTGRPPHELVLTGELVPPEGRGDEVEGAAPEGPDVRTVRLPGLGLVLRAEARDEALPALADLTDPERSRRMLEGVLRAAGRHGLAIERCEPDVVRYKPGSRCTVVYRLTYPAGADPSWPTVVVGKTHQGDKGAVAWGAMCALWDTPLARGDVVALAEPLGFDPDRRVLVQGPVPGAETLKERVRAALVDGGDEALGGLREALRRTAVALAALHGSGVRYGRTASWDEEHAELRDVVDRLALTVPQVRAAAAPLVAGLEAYARATPADPGVSAHHDFRPAQVLLHGDGVGFIDFDGACTAEPALDLGRFTAKLRDTAVSTPAPGGGPLRPDTLPARLELADELAEVFVGAYEAVAPVTRARVTLWESTDLLTGLLHAWTKARVHRVGPRLAVLEHHLRSTGAVAGTRPPGSPGGAGPLAQERLQRGR